MVRAALPTASTKAWLIAIGTIVGWLTSVAVSAAVAYSALQVQITKVETKADFTYEWMIRIEQKLDAILQKERAAPLFPAPPLIP